MQTKQKDISDTLENAENNHNSNSTLITNETIEGTPFKLINQEEKWFIVMGDYRITTPTKTKQETLDKLQKEQWLIIMVMIGVILEKIKE